MHWCVCGYMTDAQSRSQAFQADFISTFCRQIYYNIQGHMGSMFEINSCILMSKLVFSASTTDLTNLIRQWGVGAIRINLYISKVWVQTCESV